MSNPASQLRYLLLENKALLENIWQKMQLPDKAILFQRGDPGDAFYLIESGKIRIYTLDDQGQEITLNTLLPGETFGEMALLDAQSRSASASAIGDCTLLWISGKDFLQQVHISPDLAACVIQILSGRVRHMTEYIGKLRLWSRQIVDGHYTDMIQSLEQVDLEDRAVAAAVSSMQQMAKAVQEREKTLRQEVAQLSIKIDQEKRQQQAKEITESESFQNLLKIAKQRRQARQSESP